MCLSPLPTYWAVDGNLTNQNINCPYSGADPVIKSPSKKKKDGDLFDKYSLTNAV